MGSRFVTPSRQGVLFNRIPWYLERTAAIHRPPQVMAATHLYNHEEGNYAFNVAPHGRPGCYPALNHKGASSASSDAGAFLCSPVYGGSREGLFGGPVSFVAGGSNPTATCHLVCYPMWQVSSNTKETHHV